MKLSFKKWFVSSSIVCKEFFFYLSLLTKSCYLFSAGPVIDEVQRRHFPDMVEPSFCPSISARYIYRILPPEVTVVHPYSLNDRGARGHCPLYCYHGDYNRPQPQR